MKVVAFIPLRGGGSRVGLIDGKDKERANFCGHPLMAYTICAAKQSGIFDDIIAIAHSGEHIEMAEAYGAKVPIRRPKWTIKDDSPDIEWVRWALPKWDDEYDAFAILRVTSPFRRAEHIHGAWYLFSHRPGVHSLRMVRPVTEHPGKMWTIQDGILLPILPYRTYDKIELGLPWHSSPTQNLPPIHIQTAGMEFAWFNTVRQTGTISGSVIIPYLAEYWAGFDINTREEWDQAEKAAKNGTAKLSEVK